MKNHQWIQDNSSVNQFRSNQCSHCSTLLSICGQFQRHMILYFFVLLVIGFLYIWSSCSWCSVHCSNSVWPHNMHRPFPWTWNRALWNCSWITHCANNLIVQVPVSASSGYSSLSHPCPPLILLLQIKKNPLKNLFASGGWRSVSHKLVLGFSTQSYQQLRDSSSSSSSLSIQARPSSSSSLDLWYCNCLEVVWMWFVRTLLLLSQRVFLWNSTHCRHVLSCNCGWNQPLHFFTLPRMPFDMQRETHTETDRDRERKGFLGWIQGGDCCEGLGFRG
jgi:hypothetical protein